MPAAPGLCPLRCAAAVVSPSCRSCRCRPHVGVCAAFAGVQVRLWVIRSLEAKQAYSEVHTSWVGPLRSIGTRRLVGPRLPSAPSEAPDPSQPAPAAATLGTVRILVCRRIVFPVRALYVKGLCSHAHARKASFTHQGVFEIYTLCMCVCSAFLFFIQATFK